MSRFTSNTATPPRAAAPTAPSLSSSVALSGSVTLPGFVTLIGLVAAISPALSAIAAAVDPASADDIRDIRGPKGIFPLWLVLAVVAAALLLALGAYLLWRRKNRLPPPRPLLPFEIALQGLEQIRTLMNPAKVREFSIAISDIVRKYIEDAFHLTATHRTTEEFLRDLLDSSNTSLAAHRGLLAEFLNQCDMAKFAGVSLSRQIIESLHQSARSFVIESSKPAPTTDPPEATRSTQLKEAHDSLPST